jgi:hypothetical protein
MKTLPESFTDCRASVDTYTRNHPTSTLLIAAATGFIFGVIAHALQSGMSTSRAEGFLDGLQNRLHKLGDGGNDMLHRNADRVRRFLS